MPKQEPVSIGGVWLIREGSEGDRQADAVVYVEVAGEWRQVIRERLSGNFSHAVSPNLIRGGDRAAWAVSALGILVPRSIVQATDEETA